MIVLNGEPRDVPGGTTIADLLVHLDLPAGRRGIAIAVDAEVVPRGDWEAYALADGAKVELVHAVQGG
jgi:sulfur carrier protein